MSLRDELAKRKQQLSLSQQASLQKRLKREESPGPQREAIPKRPPSPIVSASSAQKRIWFLQQLDPESPAYNEHIALRFQGPLDEAIVAHALRTMQHRHEMLRSHFQLDIEHIQLVVFSEEQAPFPFHLLSCEQSTREERESAAYAYISNESQRLFSLTDGVLWRTTLIRLDLEDHILLTVLHHSICDAWSIALFNREFLHLYETFRQGKVCQLSPLTIQYTDFAHWQQQAFEQDKRFQQQLAYWKKQLGGPLPVLELPTTRLRPAIQSTSGSRYPITLPYALYRQLQAFSRQEGATLFMILLAAFALTLYRYTHQEEIIIGTLIAGRTRPEFEPIIGLFANTLALRLDLRGNPSCQELIRRTRNVALEAYAHQDIAFERLVEYLQPGRSTSHTPIFQTMLVLQNVPPVHNGIEHVQITPLEELEHTTAKFDLMLNLQEGPQGISGYLEYTTDLFDADFIATLCNHFSRVLSLMATSSSQHIASLPLLSEPERERLLSTWNSTTRPYPYHTGFIQLFEAQVAKTPSALAVVDGEIRVTYAELNSRATILAHHLRACGVGTEVIVALLAARSWKFLAALLAIFKAGGAYLPLDPHAPASRLALLLENSQYVLTTPELFPQLEAVQREKQAMTILDIEALLSTAPSGRDPSAQTTGEQLAYVIYTSGSTGQPKGAMLTQQGMINHLYSKITDLHITETDRVAQTASHCFDISIWQFLAPLLVGAQVHIFEDSLLRDPHTLFERVQQNQITLLELVPSLLEIALDVWQRQGPKQFPSLPSLRWLLLTGEALPPALTRSWFEHYPHIPLLNAYGPTECSDDVATIGLTEPVATSAMYTPIGRPIANTQLHVLTPQLEPVPVGVSGELYVGGIGVGRGYLNNPARTAEVFLPDPFSHREGARLYKTGDRVRWQANGTLEYLGRLDAQIKLRGYRIEPGEIEAILSQHPSVRQSVLTLREDEPGNKCLVAYIIPAQGWQPEPEQLRQFLRQRLPSYMLPAFFIFLEALPLNENGKIDYRALPTPSPVDLPLTALEQVLLTLWRQVLGTEQVGIHDNFFDLGGQPSQLPLLMTGIYETFEVELPLLWLIEHPTVAQLSRVIEQECQEYGRMKAIAELFLKVSCLSDEEVTGFLQEHKERIP